MGAGRVVAPPRHALPAVAAGHDREPEPQAQLAQRTDRGLGLGFGQRGEDRRAAHAQIAGPKQRQDVGMHAGEQVPDRIIAVD